MTDEIRRTYCGLCHPRCGTLLHIEDGRAVSLITGSNFMPMYHSEQRQVKAAREKHPDPRVLVHPETAGKLGLNDGDWARVVTPLGTARQRVHTWEGMNPNMVDAEHGWWFPEKEGGEPELFGVFGSNANVLCPNGPEFCSPEIGSWPHSALICRLEKEG